MTTRVKKSKNGNKWSTLRLTSVIRHKLMNQRSKNENKWEFNVLAKPAHHARHEDCSHDESVEKDGEEKIERHLKEVR